VVVGCGEGYAYALDLKTGKKIWEFKAEGDVKAISIKDNIVILGCAERYIRAPVYALDLKTGNKIWEFKFEVESDVKVISIKDNIVILGCRYNKDLGYAPVYALDLNKYKKVLEMIENKK
jgi:outer membrane protein assembly factor BamB